MPARRLLLWSLLLGPCLVACDRPLPLNAPAPAASATTPGTAAASPGAPAVVVPPRPNTPPVPTLEREYLASLPPDRRLGVLYQLHDAPAAEAVPAVGRLLQAERDPDLRVELLDSLAVWGEQVEAKLAILRRELLEEPARTEVHEAALDALLDIQDRRAIPLWRQLAETAGDEVRDTARAAIADLESLGGS